MKSNKKPDNSGIASPMFPVITAFLSLLLGALRLCHTASKPMAIRAVSTTTGAYEAKIQWQKPADVVVTGANSFLWLWKFDAVPCCHIAKLPCRLTRMFIVCLLLFAFNCKLLAGGFDSASVGTNSAQFLKIAVGARQAAMGEAYTAMPDDASAIFWNTAGLIKIKKQSLVMMHMPYLADMYYDYIAYAQNAGSVGAWGFSMQYLNAGSIKKTNSSGIDIGSFSPYDLAISVGFACYVTGYNKEPWQRFVLGANGKFIRSQIIGSDSTVSADVGINFPYMFDNRFRMAIVAQNIMGTLRFDKYEYPLPMVFRFGTATEISKYFIVTADITAPKDNYAYLSMGAEININVAKTATVSLRSGFNTRALFDFEGLRNVTIGTGIRYREYSLDYAFSPYGELGNVHRISAGFEF